MQSCFVPVIFLLHHHSTSLECLAHFGCCVRMGIWDWQEALSSWWSCLLWDSFERDIFYWETYGSELLDIFLLSSWQNFSEKAFTFLSPTAQWDPISGSCMCEAGPSWHVGVSVFRRDMFIKSILFNVGSSSLPRVSQLGQWWHFWNNDPLLCNVLYHG